MKPYRYYFLHNMVANWEGSGNLGVHPVQGSPMMVSERLSVSLPVEVFKSVNDMYDRLEGSGVFSGWSTVKLLIFT